MNLHVQRTLVFLIVFEIHHYKILVRLPFRHLCINFYKQKPIKNFMEPIMHVIIPLLVLLALFPKMDKKLAVGLAFLVFIPDMDFFIDFTHRFLFHNIFFTTGLSLLIYLFSRNLKIFLISLYYLTSHLILDLTVGAVALFYPLYQRLIDINITLNSKWIFDLSIRTYPLTETSSYLGPKISYFFTEVGVITALLLLIMLIIKYKKRLFNYIRIPFPK